MTVGIPADRIDDSLRDDVLACYKPHCRYLSAASVTAVTGHTDGLACRATFAIPESCYIDSTGHLNAVEVNICFNQMLYVAVAGAVARGLAKPFTEWSMIDFWRRQLPDILITRITSEFRSPINPNDFHGEVVFDEINARRMTPDAPALVSMSGGFTFGDSNGGCARGSARIAIVPWAARG